MIKKKKAIGVSLALIATTCLMINHHKQQEIKKGYQKYINQEFNKDMKIQKWIFDEQFVIPIKTYKNNEERRKIDELEKQQLEKKRQEENQWINLICTFYTGAEEENGIGNSGITASGKELSRGMCASNAHKFGTKIYTSEFGILEVQDTGNPKYIHQVNDNTYRIDVFIPDKQLADKLGVMKVKGKIIK